MGRFHQRQGAGQDVLQECVQGDALRLPPQEAHWTQHI